MGIPSGVIRELLRAIIWHKKIDELLFDDRIAHQVVRRGDMELVDYAPPL